MPLYVALGAGGGGHAAERRDFYGALAMDAYAFD